MPSYAYSGKARNGLSTKGTIEAPSRDSAVQQLRAKGITIFDLREPVALPGVRQYQEMRASPEGFQSFFDYFGFTFVPQKALAVYTRKLATMLKAGLGYGQIFTILGDESENPRLTRISRDMATKIGRGLNLQALYHQHPAVFPPVFQSMIRAGEISGRMDHILEELARVYDKEVELRTTVMSRLYYPLALLVIAMGLLLLMVTVIPAWLGSVAPEGMEFYRGMFNAGSVFGVITIYALIGATILFCRTKPGYTIFRSIITYVPYLGGLLKKISLIRFTRLLAAMYASGVPIMEALDVAEETVVEPYLKLGVRRAAAMVNSGHDLNESLAASGVFPDRVLTFVRTGEVAGDLEAMLKKVADYYEMEAESQSQMLGVVGYFVVYLGIAFTVGWFVIKAWAGYFSGIMTLAE